MRNDDESAPYGLLVFFNPLGYGANGIHIQAGVGLVEDRHRRRQHQKLQDLCLLLLAARKSHIQIPLGIGRIHSQNLHGLLQALLEIPYPDMLACLRLQRRTDEVGQGNPRNLDRILKRQKHPHTGDFVGGFLRDVNILKEDPPLFHHIPGISHQRRTERGLSRAIRSHDHMDLPLADGQIHAVQDLLVLDTNLQVADFYDFF